MHLNIWLLTRNAIRTTTKHGNMNKLYYIQQYMKVLKPMKGWFGTKITNMIEQ